MYEKYFKRALDFLLSLVLILALSPIFTVVFILVRLKLGNPALFVQARPGKDGKIFRVRKFRTMTNARDTGGILLPDSQRSTALGRFLRKTSLDEIPQLFNVLLGDMSFVGPRPLLVEYLPHYQGEDALRHRVRPGITGLAQVSGRNEITWRRKFDCDLRYVRNVTFAGDVKIFLLTIKKVFAGSGIQSIPQELPMHKDPNYMGHDDSGKDA